MAVKKPTVKKNLRKESFSRWLLVGVESGEVLIRHHPQPGMWLTAAVVSERTPKRKEGPRDQLGGPGESLYLGKGLRGFVWVRLAVSSL